MTGIEILAVEEVITAYAFNWKGFLIFITCAVVFCGILGAISNSPYSAFKGALVGMAIGLLLGGILGQLPAWTTLPKEYETRYKITISDEVSMNDFLSKYEIVDQEGKIYTVVERNEE